MINYETPKFIQELLDFDTPTITNAVASYPNNPNCLSIYHPWKGKWYTDETLKCMYPELGRRAGYAVTCVYGPVDPDFANKYSLFDVFKAIDESPKPVILAIKQDFPEEIKKNNGLAGGMMMSSFKSLGTAGVLSDGPSRDLDEVRPFGIQYMLTGVSPGHGDFSVYAINVPVNICGMEIAPGDIVHMDENGAVKFPANRLVEVVEAGRKMTSGEQIMQKKILDAVSLEEIINVFKGK
jgi:regulator of RNase E activity RraA